MSNTASKVNDLGGASAFAGFVIATWETFRSKSMQGPRFSAFSLLLKGRMRTTTITHSGIATTGRNPSYYVFPNTPLKKMKIVTCFSRRRRLSFLVFRVYPTDLDQYLHVCF